MEEQFSLTELVKFGQYVLSEERVNWIKENHAEEDSVTVEERLRQIYDADIQNFKLKL